MTKNVIVPLESARLIEYAVPISCYICDGQNNFDAEYCRYCQAPLALAHQANTQKTMPSMVACMGACESPVSLGLQGAGRASYVFAGVQPTQDAADIAATCQTYLDAPAGWIEDARPCGRLRDCLRARLPALL